jgi:hypothetical protein
LRFSGAGLFQGIAVSVSNALAWFIFQTEGM